MPIAHVSQLGKKKKGEGGCEGSSIDLGGRGRRIHVGGAFTDVSAEAQCENSPNDNNNSRSIVNMNKAT